MLYYAHKGCDADGLILKCCHYERMKLHITVVRYMDFLRTPQIMKEVEG